MEVFVPFLTVLSVVLPVSVCSVLIARIYRKNAALDPKITHKLRKQQEDYIAELEHGKRKLQNKLNSMQKGPQIEDTGDSIGMIPELLDGMEQVGPKWLGGAIKTIKSNPTILNLVTNYAKEHPEKAAEFMQSIVGKFIKTGPKATATDQAAVSGL